MMMIIPGSGAGLWSLKMMMTVPGESERERERERPVTGCQGGDAGERGEWEDQ
jgi:hypothetical protein